MGNVLHIGDFAHPTNTQDFVYDDLSRLTQAIGNGYGTLNYTYDEIGNLKQKGDVDYTYGEIDQEGKKIRPHAVISGTDGSEFTYDKNGNMKTVQSITPEGTAHHKEYFYDQENRLIVLCQLNKGMVTSLG